MKEAAILFAVALVTWIVQEVLKKRVEKKKEQAEAELAKAQEEIKKSSAAHDVLKTTVTAPTIQKSEVEALVQSTKAEAEKKARELAEISERTTATRNELQVVLKENEYFIKGLRSPVIVPKGDRRNSVVLLGLGGVGKTSLIGELLRIKDPKPSEKTTR